MTKTTAELVSQATVEATLAVRRAMENTCHDIVSRPVMDGCMVACLSTKAAVDRVVDRD